MISDGAIFYSLAELPTLIFCKELEKPLVNGGKGRVGFLQPVYSEFLRTPGQHPPAGVNQGKSRGVVFSISRLIITCHYH